MARKDKALSLMDRHNAASAELASALSTFDEIAELIEAAQARAAEVAEDAERQIEELRLLADLSRQNVEQGARSVEKIRALFA